MASVLIDAFHATDMKDLGGPIEPQTTQEVSDSIFRDYLIPFEAVSFLLLAALIGAIVVARRE